MSFLFYKYITFNNLRYTYCSILFFSLMTEIYLQNLATLDLISNVLEKLGKAKSVGDG